MEKGSKNFLDKMKGKIRKKTLKSFEKNSGKKSQKN